MNISRRGLKSYWPPRIPWMVPATTCSSISFSVGASLKIDLIFDKLLPDWFEQRLTIINDNELKENKIITILGCGGNRDPLKRPIMGKIASDLSDYCIFTSDNPRTEDPASIVKDLEEGIKTTGAPYICIVDRREAIKYAVKNAQVKTTKNVASETTSEKEFEKDVLQYAIDCYWLHRSFVYVGNRCIRNDYSVIPDVVKHNFVCFDCRFYSNGCYNYLLCSWSSY